MLPERKIQLVLERIKHKAELSPKDSVIEYRAGWELDKLGGTDEILILNKLASEGIIKVVGNYSSDY